MSPAPRRPRPGLPAPRAARRPAPPDAPGGAAPAAPEDGREEAEYDIRNIDGSPSSAPPPDDPDVIAYFHEDGACVAKPFMDDESLPLEVRVAYVQLVRGCGASPRGAVTLAELNDSYRRLPKTAHGTAPAALEQLVSMGLAEDATGERDPVPLYRPVVRGPAVARWL
jgi:hypothetical protein